MKNVEHKKRLAQKTHEARVARGILTHLSCSQRKNNQTTYGVFISRPPENNMLSSQLFLTSNPNQFWKILDKEKREVFNFLLSVFM